MRFPVLRSCLVIALIATVSVPAHAAEPNTQQSFLVDEMLPEALLEPPPVNKVLRTLAKGQRVLPFCLGLERLGDLQEPKPYDIPALTSYANTYWATAQTISFKIEVLTGRGGNTKKIDLPGDVMTAVLVQQAQMYAYTIRVSSVSSPDLARTVYGRDLSGSVVQRELNTAFLRLVNSSFSTAERTLTGAYKKYCTSESGSPAR